MKNTRAWLALVVLVGGLAWVQAWLLGLPHAGFLAANPASSFTYQYTDALAHGRSYLPLRPDPRLLAAANPYDREHAPFIRVDLSYYHGHFYLYFGVAPYLLVMVPWFKVTGTFLSDAAVIWLFSVLGLGAYSAAVWLLGRHIAAPARGAVAWLALCAAIATNDSWVLLARPSTYELASATAFGIFGVAVLACVAAALFPNRAGRWLAPGAVALGLTMGCRPNLAPAVCALSLWMIGQALRAEAAARRRRLAAVVLPLTAIGAFLAWYNFQRFGNPLEFGFRYQGGATARIAHGLLTLSNLPYNLHRYLLGLPNLGYYFPFFLGEAFGPFPLPKPVPPMLLYGCLVCTPAIIAGVWAFLRVGPAPPSAVRSLGWALLGGALGDLLLLSVFDIGCYRYPVDFLAPLSLLAALGVLRLGQVTRRLWRWSLLGLMATLIGASALMVFLQTISIAQIWGQFDLRRPADFARLARPFDAAAYAVERLVRAGPHAIRLTVTFPFGRSGHSEPLVVRGSPGAIDILYVYYPAPGLIALGLSGGPLTGEIPVDYGQSHAIEVRYGNNLPPADHPLLAGFAPQDMDLARRMITVLLDGRIVLDGWMDYCRTDGNVRIGISPDEPAFGPRFTGVIKKIAYPPLAIPASPLWWRHTAYGPVQITVRSVPMPVGAREPLLSCGQRGQGVQALLERLEQGRVRLGWIGTDGRDIWGAPVAWADDREHVIRIDAGVLFPPEASSLWPANLGTTDVTRFKSRLQIRLDGAIVLQGETAPGTVSPATVAVGRDDLYLKDRVTPAFMGRIESVERLPW
ncbi:MAG TPA: hypothetical protein VLW52_05700 [Opitutaceae bacterium]|nr:hypothetical protein [Opitutaceae bacterium]